MEGYNWPEHGLSYRAHAYPKRFLVLLGYALGYRSGRIAKDVQRYYQKHKEKEAIGARP